jgi:hypothetical protein
MCEKNVLLGKWKVESGKKTIQISQIDSKSLIFESFRHNFIPKFFTF